ncbi:helix-turn-helix domain-containing protein [Rhizosphaericola mali]|uniref:Helix-turn-helix transcriptional regulator n=1 Tax=Rhizosphaericola mali TaxID=2545455 RepID=A0A5P2G6Q0_9BACT|nr:helix-turn-helix transcriptional regulator [Rhizosphaericola mali]QES88903.1 helix-turn-helix transcriptional regulator [Rhizosphaericola mali]
MSIAYGPNFVLITARECCELKAEDIAEKLEIPLSDYEDIESGAKQITSDLAQKLGQIFNITPELFMYRMAETINYNTGQGSHSGPIYTYNNHSIWGIDKTQIEKIIKGNSPGKQ